MNISMRVVTAKAGMNWWLEAWVLVKEHILFTLGMCLFLLLPGIFEQIPILGGAVEALLVTPLTVGSLLVFRAWSEGQKVGFGTFFRPFRELALFKRLLPLTGLVLAFAILADLCLVVEQIISNPDYLAKYTFRFSLTPTSLFFYFLMLICYATYMGILQFFAPLVCFRNMSLGEAWETTKEILRLNWRPILVNVLFGLALLGIAILPYGLGILVWLPLYTAMPYVMYVELFERG